MSEWILLGNVAVRQADICKIEMQLSGPMLYSYTVTMRTGERLSVREEQTGGKWLYLKVKEATETSWAAAKQADAEEEEDA